MLGEMLTQHHLTTCNLTVSNFLTRFSPLQYLILLDPNYTTLL